MRLTGDGTPENRLYRIEELSRGKVSFGHPTHPHDPADVTTAGTSATAHNGLTDNLRGTWAEVTFEATDTAVEVWHNLGVPVINSELNVRWLEFGMQHDGTAATGTSAVTILHEVGDGIDEDSIDLRLYVAATRTVDGDHPLKASLFFIPAVRGVL